MRLLVASSTTPMIATDDVLAWRQPQATPGGNGCTCAAGGPSWRKRPPFSRRRRLPARRPRGRCATQPVRRSRPGTTRRTGSRDGGLQLRGRGPGASAAVQSGDSDGAAM